MTKQRFCLFLQSAEHYVSYKERKYTGFDCELQSCLLAGCSREVCRQFLHPAMVFLNEPLVPHFCATQDTHNRQEQVMQIARLVLGHCWMSSECLLFLPLTCFYL